jgi:hypothetical protein
MVKIINGVIQSTGGEDGSGEADSSSADDSTINLCGYRVAKWMPLAGIVAALFLFGIKGVLLVSGGIFVAYIISNGSTAQSSSQSQVNYNIYHL